MPAPCASPVCASADSVLVLKVSTAVAVSPPLLTSVVTSAGMLTDTPGNIRGAGGGEGDDGVLDDRVLAMRLEVRVLLLLLAVRLPDPLLAMPGN